MELSMVLARTLQRCALKGHVLTYHQFHGLCGKDVDLESRYVALEKAVMALANPVHIDYGVLLAADNDLPGKEFFLRYLRLRRMEYIEQLGDPRYQVQKMVRKRALVTHERERVYAHARNTRIEKIAQEVDA